MSELAHATAPLRIDAVVVPSGGMIGMLGCPGRNGLDGQGRCWSRVLVDDLAAIKAWRADMLISLIEPHEFDKLGVPGFARAVADAGLVWHHLPIPDMHTPDATTLAAWAKSGPEILASLGDGGRVAIHCAAGLGRTGTIAAKIMVALGVPGGVAIANVRSARPGTIETAAQEFYVLHGPPLAIE